MFHLSPWPGAMLGSISPAPLPSPGAAGAGGWPRAGREGARGSRHLPEASCRAPLSLFLCVSKGRFLPLKTFQLHVSVQRAAGKRSQPFPAGCKYQKIASRAPGAGAELALPGPPVRGLALPVRAQAPTAGGIREPDGNAAPSTRLGGMLDYK